ncbi:hypothetical protein RB195_007232 [Necator americanus]|uniref:DUF4806 domain-containing protein n=1 Tax=Necator americanus TaxID=51031 RepID=A0ABR1BZU1_NECAM
MPGSTQCTLRNSSRKTKEPISTSQTVSQSRNDEIDVESLPCAEIINEILERNTDPIIKKMVLALKTKITLEVAEGAEAEKRGRSIVTTGLAELSADESLIERHRDFEEKVANVLDAFEVDCLPEVAYRLGKFNDNKLRLVNVFVVLASRSHWAKALSRAHLLRRSSLSNIFVRKSMTAAERKRDYELRHEARLRNERPSTREWVVYKDALTHVTELPREPMTGNL